jgi:hypothetical protein
MFKIKVKKRSNNPKVGDIIICSLSEASKQEYYINMILDNGILYVTKLGSSGEYVQAWPYGDNYYIMRPLKPD